MVYRSIHEVSGWRLEENHKAVDTYGIRSIKDSFLIDYIKENKSLGKDVALDELTLLISKKGRYPWLDLVFPLLWKIHAK